MDPRSNARRPLLPRIEPFGSGGQSSSASAFRNPTMPIPPKSRQSKSIIRTDQEWEQQKPNFLRLYVEEDLSLQEVMGRMEEEHNFKASKKQYNTKISQWRVGKNVKDHEMRAIVRKCRARMMENPPKDSVFRVRKNRVNSNKIARFKRDKGIDDGDVVMLDAATPSDISCYTPEVLSPSIPFSSVQSVPSCSPYFNVLSPRLQVSPTNYVFGHISPSQAFTTNVPDIDYASHHQRPLSHDPLLTRSHPNHQWLSSGSSYSPNSSLDWRVSHMNLSPMNSWLLDRAAPFGPLTTLVQLNAVAPSLFGLDSFESWNHDNVFESPSHSRFRSLLAELVRGIFNRSDFSEAQKGHEGQGVNRSDSIDEGGAHDSEPLYIPEISADSSIFDIFLHSTSKYGSVFRSFEVVLPFIETDKDVAEHAARAVDFLLALEGKYQDMKKVIEFTLLETECQPEIDDMDTISIGLFLADTYFLSVMFTMAERLGQQVLEPKLRAVRTIAADLSLLISFNEGLKVINEMVLNYGGTAYGSAYIERIVGKERIDYCRRLNLGTIIKHQAKS